MRKCHFSEETKFYFLKKNTQFDKQNCNCLTCCRSENVIHKDNEFYIFTVCYNRFGLERRGKAETNCSFPRVLLTGLYCSIYACLNHHATDRPHLLQKTGKNNKPGFPCFPYQFSAPQDFFRKSLTQNKFKQFRRNSQSWTERKHTRRCLSKMLFTFKQWIPGNT